MPSAIDRVRALPRRADADVDSLTKRFAKTPGVRLFQAQANALQEIMDLGGLFGPMRVGSGKTLVSLLAPAALNAQRPVLLIPATLEDKTIRDYEELLPHWRVRLPELMSYEELGRADRDAKLASLAPDLLILDEAHCARRLGIAKVRKIRRYIEGVESCKVICLSGTLITDKLMDYHHLSVWTLGEGAPVPIRPSEAEQWALAVDKDVGFFQRAERAADLSSLPGGFHQFFLDSRGVVSTPGEGCVSSILLSKWRPQLPDALQEIIRDVELTSERPDGELLDEWDLPDCLCQLALGFYYRWDPAPPVWWLKPRRTWRAYVQEILDQHIDGFDSELQIVNALDNEEVEKFASYSTGKFALHNWRAVRDQFVPNPVSVWLTDEVLHQVVRTAAPGTLIWVKQVAVGERLAEMGVPYYGAGTNPEAAKPGSTIALSIAAHGTGINMQHHWHKNLVLHPPANAEMWEQMIGRTHRAGQKADEILVRVISAVDYHDRVMRRVRAEARRLTNASGFSFKISLATLVDE